MKSVLIASLVAAGHLWLLARPAPGTGVDPFSAPGTLGSRIGRRAFPEDRRRPKARTSKMEWTRSETIALAKNCCTQCHGLGLRPGRSGRPSPCNCVLRGIFRACYARFRHCASKEKYMSRISLDFIPGRERSFSWGRKDEEYMADFVLVTRRTLNAPDFKVFTYHYLLGADWSLCCRKLKLDRGNFFHTIYRIEQNLGRVFRELEPYSLFPLEDYFRISLRDEVLLAPRSATMRIPPAEAGFHLEMRRPA